MAQHRSSRVTSRRVRALEREVAERARELTTLSAIAAAVNQSLDLNDTLRQALDMTLQVMAMEAGGICLVDAERCAPLVTAQEELAPELVLEINRTWAEESPAGDAVKPGQLRVIGDISADERLAGSAFGSEGFRSLAIVRLTSRRKALGTLLAATRKVREFTERDLQLLTSIGHQVGVAVENARLYEDARHRLNQLGALQETIRAVASTLDLDALLTLIIEQATALLGADGGLVNLVDWEKQEDEVVAAAGMAVSVLGTRNSLDSGLSGWVTLHNQPVVSNDVPADSRTAPAGRPWVTDFRVQSAVLAPLTVKDKIIGTLLVAGTEEGRRSFAQDDLDLLVAFANQAAVAIENARLYQKAHELAAAQERNRLARELHDAVTQNLFSASLIAEVLPATWAADPAEGQELLAQLRQLSRGALAEMRTLLMELRPSALAEAKLGDLLKQLADAVSGRTGLPVVLSIDMASDPPVEVRIALYRIAQEALNNVVRHAQARRVTLELACSPGESGRPGRAAPGARLCIADDGRGFDTDAISAEHLGLRIMRERAASIGAELNIWSQAGLGTRVSVRWTGGSEVALEGAPGQGVTGHAAQNAR